MRDLLWALFVMGVATVTLGIATTTLETIFGAIEARRQRIKLAILMSLRHDGFATGRELYERLARTDNRVWRGSIYVYLSEMEDEGLVRRRVAWTLYEGMQIKRVIYQDAGRPYPER